MEKKSRKAFCDWGLINEASVKNSHDLLNWNSLTLWVKEDHFT